jgi:DNA gyrase subunit A
MAEMTGRVIPVPIEEEMKTSYLNYAMSVIVARALPDVRDGLKPVHRRLLFAMDELGLRPGASTKKSARITGDAMGKYHPHGDLSLYDALVRMAQDFSLRYPLVQGQGNFGSVDGDPPAASRYTEAKLSKVGEEMLIDLEKETVDFVPNYDGSLKEPVVLPGAFPNLLVNGSSGIAVGMATNMPPHNLIEVCNAICAYIENPECTIEDLMKHVTAPDFPTGGIIFGRRGVKEAYRSGRGKIIVRGKFNIETSKTGKESIIFTEIPYTVNKAQLVSRIAELARDKVIEGIGDLRDESDREGMRIVIEVKKGAIPKIILNHLFTHTALQSSFGVINLALVNGMPKLLNLKELVHYFVRHRVNVVTRRAQFDLRKAKEREHILAGLVIALKNIDEVIQIIKSSNNVDHAKIRLMERFDLSEIQSQAIVDMRLGKLTSLETEKIEAELAEIRTLIAYLEDLLSSETKILAVIKDETGKMSQKYGTPRKTEIVADEIEQINIEDLIKREEMVILISNKGFIKRLSTSVYRSQSRGGKGMNASNLMEEDFLAQLFVANTHDYLLFISSAGKAYWLKVHEIPECSRQARGTHIKGLLQISPNEEITTIVDFPNFSDKSFLLMGTLKGVVKKVMTSEFQNAKTRGIISISLDEGDSLVSACLTHGADEVVLITRMGQALKMNETDVRCMGRASRGVRGIRLDANDELTAMLPVSANEKMLLVSENGYGKRVEFDNFNNHRRGTGGQVIYMPDDKTGELIACITVTDDDDVMVITSQGKTIKFHASDVSIQGKGARGVRIVNIDKPDFVIGMDKIIRDEDEAALEAAKIAHDAAEIALKNAPDASTEVLVDEAIEPDEANVDEELENGEEKESKADDSEE